MRKAYLITTLVFALGACSNVDQHSETAKGAASVTQPALKAQHIVGKFAQNVDCLHIKNEAIEHYADCEIESATVLARFVDCDDIILDFIRLYSECADPKIAVVRNYPFTISSLSSGGLGSEGFISGSTLSVNANGVKTVSNTVGNKTISISSDVGISSHPIMRR